MNNPGCWHLCAAADFVARNEQVPSERRRQERFYATSPSLSRFNPDMPWDAPLRAVASDTDFWYKHLEKPCDKAGRDGTNASPVQRMSSTSVPPYNVNLQVGGGSSVHSQGNLKRKRQKGNGKGGQDKGSSGKSNGQRNDGRFVKSADGVQICFAWSRSADGCAAEGPCPQGRAHICEFCRSSHRTVRCPSNPNWKPPPAKGKGK